MKRNILNSNKYIVGGNCMCSHNKLIKTTVNIHNINSKGVTLVALIITIIVLLILAGVTITAGVFSADSYTDAKLESEIKMVQTAVVSQYDKYLIVKDTSLLVGDKCDESGNLDLSGEYNLLTPTDLEEIGMKNPIDTYIVNYRTGEVINKTSQKNDGTTLKLDGISE